MAEFEKVAELSELQSAGATKIVPVNGREVALFNVDGKVCAIENVCPHKGGPLGEGMLEGNVVTCPWHGWQFDVTTGKSPVVATASVPCYEVKVDGTAVLVKAGPP